MSETRKESDMVTPVDYAVAVRAFEATHGRKPSPTERQRIIDRQRALCNSRGDVQELRERVAASGVQLRSKTDPVLLARIIDHVRDVDLAAQAILMEPRPQWVRTLIGADLMKVHPRV